MRLLCLIFVVVSVEASTDLFANVALDANILDKLTGENVDTEGIIKPTGTLEASAKTAEELVTAKSSESLNREEKGVDHIAPVVESEKAIHAEEVTEAVKPVIDVPKRPPRRRMKEEVNPFQANKAEEEEQRLRQMISNIMSQGNTPASISKLEQSMGLPTGALTQKSNNGNQPNTNTRDTDYARDEVTSAYHNGPQPSRQTSRRRPRLQNHNNFERSGKSQRRPSRNHFDRRRPPKNYQANQGNHNSFDSDFSHKPDMTPFPMENQRNAYDKPTGFNEFSKLERNNKNQNNRHRSDFSNFKDPDFSSFSFDQFFNSEPGNNKEASFDKQEQSDSYENSRMSQTSRHNMFQSQNKRKPNSEFFPERFGNFNNFEFTGGNQGNINNNQDFREGKNYEDSERNYFNSKQGFINNKNNLYQSSRGGDNKNQVYNQRYKNKNQEYNNKRFNMKNQGNNNGYNHNEQFNSKHDFSNQDYDHNFSNQDYNNNQGFNSKQDIERYYPDKSNNEDYFKKQGYKRYENSNQVGNNFDGNKDFDEFFDSKFDTDFFDNFQSQETKGRNNNRQHMDGGNSKRNGNNYNEVGHSSHNQLNPRQGTTANRNQPKQKVSGLLKEREEECMRMVMGRGMEHHTETQTRGVCQQYLRWNQEAQRTDGWKPSPAIQKWWMSLATPEVITNPSLNDLPQVTVLNETTSIRGRRSLQHMQRNPSHLHNQQRSRHLGTLRKEYRMMRPEEREAFHKAVNTLKWQTVDGVSKYDIFVYYHQASLSPAAHFSPASFGWHREFLLRFERALQAIDVSVSLPYWDSSTDGHLGDQAADSIMWTDTFAGNAFGAVVSGPFSNWQVPLSSDGKLLRYLGWLGDMPMMESTKHPILDVTVREIMFSKSLGPITWYLNPRVESDIMSTLLWVSGTMSDLSLAPADPLYFLHYAFVDCIWEQSRLRKLTQYPHFDFRSDYPNDTEALGLQNQSEREAIFLGPQDSIHAALRELKPFKPLRNIDALDSDYSKLYACSPRPMCTQKYPYCNSPYLFCHTKRWTCIAKLQIGKDCTVFKDFSPCYNGQCCSTPGKFQCMERC